MAIGIMYGGMHAKDVTSIQPDAISGLQLWLKADALALSEGNAVSSWTDSSSNANAAVQATGTKQPTYRAAPTGFNGNPAVQFDGGDGLATGNISIATFTVFVVIKLTGTAGYIWEQTSGTYLNSLYGTTGDTALMRRSGLYSSVDRAVNWAVDNVTKIVALDWDTVNAASIHMFINGAAQTVTTVQDQGSNATPVAAPFYVGSHLGGGVAGSTGYIAEVLEYDSVLSSTNRGNVTSYLGTKYGVTVS